MHLLALAQVIGGLRELYGTGSRDNWNRFQLIGSSHGIKIESGQQGWWPVGSLVRLYGSVLLDAPASGRGECLPEFACPVGR